MSDVPPGFREMIPLDQLMTAFAPLHARLDEDGTMAIGFHVGAQHCNPLGHCHGGTWATIADVLMGFNIGMVTGMSGPTISLNIDFLGAASKGQWVEGVASVLRWTPNLGFAECRFTAQGELALRASAVFRRKRQAIGDFGKLVAPS